MTQNEFDRSLNVLSKKLDDDLCLVAKDCGEEIKVFSYETTRSIRTALRIASLLHKHKDVIKGMMWCDDMEKAPLYENITLHTECNTIVTGRSRGNGFELLGTNWPLGSKHSPVKWMPIPTEEQQQALKEIMEVL